MTDKFEAKIRDRANEQTNDAIRAFRGEVIESLRKLMCLSSRSSTLSDDEKKCLANLIEPHRRDADKNSPVIWPAALWTRRQDALRSEIFAQIDVVQRTLQAKVQSPTEIENIPNTPI